MSKVKFPVRLDPNFEPMILKLREFKERVAASSEKTPVAFCVERNNGYKFRYELDVIPTDKDAKGILESCVSAPTCKYAGFIVWHERSSGLF